MGGGRQKVAVAVVGSMVLAVAAVAAYHHGALIVRFHLHQLRTGDRDARKAAVEALASRGPAAVPLVIDVLESDGPEGRVLAAVALGRIGLQAKDAVPALILALAGEEVEERLSNLYYTAEALPELLLLAEWAEADPDWARHAACWALVRIGGSAIRELLYATTASDPGVRQLSRDALFRMGSPRMVPAFLEVLGDRGEAPQVRANAAIYVRTSRAPHPTFLPYLVPVRKWPFSGVSSG